MFRYLSPPLRLSSGSDRVRGMNDRVVAALSRHADHELSLKPDGDFWVGRYHGHPE